MMCERGKNLKKFIPKSKMNAVPNDCCQKIGKETGSNGLLSSDNFHPFELYNHGSVATCKIVIQTIYLYSERRRSTLCHILLNIDGSIG